MVYLFTKYRTYRSEGRNNNQLSALPPVSQTSSSTVWLERWLEAICGRCWVDNFLKHAWLSSKDYMTMWKGLGGHRANDERGRPKRCFNECFLHYILDLMFWHHSHDFSPLKLLLWTYLSGHSKWFFNNQTWEASHRRQPLHSLLQ